MTDMREINYALAIAGAVYHVALALDRSATGGMLFEDLARGYKHAVLADLTRVKRHEKVKDDTAAKEWIIRRAIEYLAAWVETVDDVVCFAVGVGFDDLMFDGSKLMRPEPDRNAGFGDPFSPHSGFPSDNIRDVSRDDLGELRESMKASGWLKEFPAFQDERGVVLVGHRRLKVARELGIDPVIVTLQFGQGDEADVERFKLAIASNIGSKPFTPEDRKRIAGALKAEGWTLEAIAKALNSSAPTISRDTKDIFHDEKSRGTDTRGRKRSTGRPHAPERAPAAQQPQPQAKPQPAKVPTGKGNGRTKLQLPPLSSLPALTYADVMDDPQPQPEPPQLVERPLSESAKQQLERYQRVYRQTLEAEFEERHSAMLSEEVARLVAADLKAMRDYAAKLEAAKFGVFTIEQVKILRAVLHPDNSASEARRNEAFALFEEVADLLTISPAILPELKRVSERKAETLDHYRTHRDIRAEKIREQRDKWRKRHAEETAHAERAAEGWRKREEQARQAKAT